MHFFEPFDMKDGNVPRAARQFHEHMQNRVQLAEQVGSVIRSISYDTKHLIAITDPYDIDQLFGEMDYKKDEALLADYVSTYGIDELAEEEEHLDELPTVLERVQHFFGNFKLPFPFQKKQQDEIDRFLETLKED